jgi:hypothetical protein
MTIHLNNIVMKNLTICFFAFSLLLLKLNAQSPAVNGEILADTNNITILKVWGTSEERGYAYGYLLNEGIKEVSTGFIQPWIGSGNYATARQLLMENEALLIDEDFRNEAMAVVIGMADAGVDTTDFDHIDLMAISFSFTLQGFFGKSGFGCSTFLNWGDATANTDLEGGSVISRHYDSPMYIPAGINNEVLTIFLPTEENTQPWLNAEMAGWLVPSGAGVNQAGISIFQNSMNDCSGSPQPGVGYEPFELVSRRVLESADYNGDGVNNTQDVRDAINTNPQGYVGAWIISTLAGWDSQSDSLTALIAEIAPTEPYLTFRTNSYEDLIPGDNLYAANSSIKRNNAQNYCTRYMNMVNHMGDGAGIGSQENWDLMADYSHPITSYNYMLCQHIPGWNIFNISTYRDNTQAYLLDPLVLDLGELFNRAPQFDSEPDTLGIINVVYLYEISVFDPDPLDTISIWAEQLPEWLNLIDHGDETALLSGTPTETGIFQVALKTSDNYGVEDMQEFDIDVMLVAAEVINRPDFKIYPNPASGMLMIESPVRGELIILSLSGKLLKTCSLEKTDTQIDIHDLMPGIYLFSFEGEGFSSIKKIIKIQ